MKVLLFNCHGKMKIAPDLKVASADKNIIFLCKEGKTLSVDQVKEFIDHLLDNNSLDGAISNSSINIDRYMNPKEVLDTYSSLKIEEKNIKDPILLKIAHLKIEKLEGFLRLMFDQHDKVERIIPDLTLSHDDVNNGVVAQIVNHLQSKNFINIGITIYADNNVIEKDQLYLMCDFQQLKNTSKTDVVYITPSQHVNPLELSYVLEKFNHAYLVYNNTNLLEAFLNLQSDDKHLIEINNYIRTDPSFHLYDFGQENSNVVLGACREYDGFSFGYEV